MEIFKDFKFYMFSWTVLTCIMQWYISTKLTSVEVTKLKKDFEKFEEIYNRDKKDRTDLLLKVSNDVSHIKGQLESDSKIIKILEKVINK